MPYAEREKGRERARRYHAAHVAEAKANHARYYAENKDHCRSSTMAWRTRHPSFYRDHHLRQRYGLSAADYERMLMEQGGRCKICGATRPGGKRRHFFVDHRHGDGGVRGLLCYNCNFLLGHCREDISILASAALYLRGLV